MRRDLPQRRRDRREKIGRADSGAVRHRSIVAPLTPVSTLFSPTLHAINPPCALCASAVKNPQFPVSHSRNANFKTMPSARHTGETPVPPTPPLLPLVPGPWSLTPRLQQEAHP